MIYDNNNNRSLSRGRRQFVEPRKSHISLSIFLPKLLFSLLIAVLSTTYVRFKSKTLHFTLYSLVLWVNAHRLFDCITFIYIVV